MFLGGAKEREGGSPQLETGPIYNLISNFLAFSLAIPRAWE